METTKEILQMLYDYNYNIKEINRVYKKVKHNEKVTLELLKNGKIKKEQYEHFMLQEQILYKNYIMNNKLFLI